MNTSENRNTLLPSKFDFANEQQSAQQHSKHVSLLKKLMFSGCILVFCSVVALVIYFNYATGIDLESIAISSEGLEITNPVVTGSDNKSKYEITAEKAVQNLTDPDFIFLKKISAVVNNSEDDSYKLNSDEGTFNTKDDNLKLVNNVRIHGTNGYTAYSGFADIDLANNQFITGDYVYITSQNTSITAQEAVYNNGSLKFLGGVKVILQPTQQNDIQ